jgi:hypothetical protein
VNNRTLFLSGLTVTLLLCTSAHAQSWYFGAPTDQEYMRASRPVYAFGSGPEYGYAWLEVTSPNADELKQCGTWVYVDSMSWIWEGTVNPPDGGWGTSWWWEQPNGRVTLWTCRAIPRFEICHVDVCFY